MLIARGVARGIHVAASLSIFGAVAARLIFYPIALASISSDAGEKIIRSMNRLLRVSLFIAVAAGAIWLVFETIYIIVSDRWSDVIASLPPVVWDTNFGHLLIIRLVLLTLAVVMFRITRIQSSIYIATGLAALATMLQAGLGHGAAMGGIEGNALLVALVLHLLAAGLWLGGLLPLFISISVVPPQTAYRIVRRFSVLGTVCVLTLISTAAVQAWFLVGGFAGLVGTAYGRVAIAKIIMFSILIILASCNRILFTPALIGDHGYRARSHLLYVIFGEMLVGLTVVILAGVLLELPPGMDMAMAGNM